MTPEQKEAEVKRLLAYIYFEWGKVVTPELVNYWRIMLKGINRKLAWKAAKLLVERKPFGEPKFGDFAECLREVQPVERKRYNPWRSPEPVSKIINRNYSEMVQLKLLK